MSAYSLPNDKWKKDKRESMVVTKTKVHMVLIHQEE